MCHSAETDIRLRKVVIPILFDPNKIGDRDIAEQQAEISRIQGSNISFKAQAKE